MDRYTTLAAEQLVEQKKEIGWTQLGLDPPWTFFKTYVLRRGFLDGIEGLAIAHMAALYNFVKYAKAKNMSPRR
jgi:(heptosyl)LPS beta-1,4-glucosyltransferase